jgi:EAL domain-containing protein (putative c-di-GMP-specific phosphodiesterase class I)
MRQVDRGARPVRRGAAGPVRTATAVAPGTDTGGAAVAGLLDGGAVRSVFQPIVELSTGRVVAYEALARGPGGHRLEAPTDLFAAARSRGLLTELDAACLRSAVGAARSGGLAPPWTLFVNTEPDSRIFGTLAALAASPAPPVVVELTERALTADPAGVLGAVALVRRFGWGVALDDVGVNPDSLALLPLIAPDVIKLDASLVQQSPDEHAARVFSAVAAEVERTGCLVVAEGIENPAHLRTACGLGAHLGQGWLFGRPGPLPAPLGAPPDEPLRLCAPAATRTERTPFGVAAAARRVRTADKALLLAMSKHLERQAAAVGESCLVLATFQTATAFAAAARRYTALADANAYVAVFGSGIGDHPARGVRGTDLDPGEPLSQEWDVVVVGAHYAVVLAARPSAGTEWDYVLSHDRDLAVRAAGALMQRITGADAPPQRAPGR